MSSYRQPGTVVTDLTFRVPLDHRDPGGEQIELFAREIVAAEHAGAELPWLLFLQGGPGFGAPRPVGRDSWLDRALQDYRVLLLDQRGTGRSSPANCRTLARLGGPQAQADYLALFRADSIVADAEIVRGRVAGGRPWTVLGQSFGGFCTVTYLSRAPDGIREAIITGGLPGLTATADDVYRLTYPTVIEKNLAHYQRYPGDVAQVRRVASRLLSSETRLPNGALLTVQAFQALGPMLGAATGSHTLHYLLENPFDGDQLSDDFRYQVQSQLTFRVRAALCAAARGLLRPRRRDALGGAADPGRVQRVRRGQGAGGRRSGAVHRGDDLSLDVRGRSRCCGRWPPPLTCWRSGTRGRTCMTPPGCGAMTCRPRPRSTSTTCTFRGTCRCATARSVRGLRQWVTSEYEHDGLRVSSGIVLDHLLALVRGEL